MSTPRRPLGAKKKVVFTLVSVACSLLLLEGTLRLLGYPTGIARSFGHLWNRDPASLTSTPGLFVPSARRRISYPPELAYDVTFNALGLRGDEVDRAPPAGVLRVLALGDSVTFGYHVPDAETWPAHLQARLREAGARVEVLNGGCGHFSIPDERAYLEERLLALQPHVVALQFCSNDVTERELLRSPTLYRETLDRGAETSLGDVLRGTALGELQLRAAIALKARRDGPLRASTFASTEPAPDAHWARYEQELAALSRTLAARGVPLLLVAFPDLGRVDEDGASPEDERLRALSSRVGVPFVSALSAFRAAPDRRALYLWPLDPHPSGRGNAVLAQVVGEALRERGLLGPR